MFHLVYPSTALSTSKSKSNLVISKPAKYTLVSSMNAEALNRIKAKKDESNNFVEGNVIAKDSNNCYLRGEKRLIAALGVKNLIVIETSDAILVADKNQSHVNKLGNLHQRTPLDFSC